MYCCTRKQSHRGQIVTGLCLQPSCARGRNQLACVLCLQEEHQGHNLTSLARHLPGLLEADRDREDHRQKLAQLAEFVSRQFGEQNEEGDAITVENVVEQAVALLGRLKQQADANSEEVAKMKSIFKNLTRNQQASPLKNLSRIEESYQPDSTFRGNQSAVLKPTQTSASKPSPHRSGHPELDCFSHSAKHPYLSISADLRTATKVSHSGHRFAAVGGKCLSQGEHEVRVRIDRSISGNILVGLCHESVVREKEFCNAYGSNSGTYLIGQNGNAPTAISFHHSLALMNRKEVVGWNFEEGDSLLVGANLANNFIYFRREAKKPSQEFSMKIAPGEIKPELKALLAEGLKFVVLLQAEGDQVSIIEE